MRFNDTVVLVASCLSIVAVTRAGPIADNSKSAGVNPASRNGSTNQFHWAFRPVLRPAPPVVKNIGWAKTGVDRFILAPLERRGISTAPTASKEELIRRVTLDLIGLPPTLREIDAFVKDAEPDAYARVV